jgi:hypothetical protein
MVTAKIRSQAVSIEEFLANPPENAEWVNGQIVEKNGVTFSWLSILSSKPAIFNESKPSCKPSICTRLMEK